MTPKVSDNGSIARLQDGDVVYIDSYMDKFTILEDFVKFNVQAIILFDLSNNEYGVGHAFFHIFRQSVNHADQGASIFMA
ncbi:hypothetical protein [Bartonella raoultii]|uniref:hypothetical protein n=1 Tax=Bartonella raoultii TaxID=1457020 RepID=UPI00280AE9F6|nr:hypothetical protein [Bartonella raoultii]